MSLTSKAQALVAITPGATWNTEAAFSGAKALHARVAIQTSKGEFTPNDPGFEARINEIISLEESVGITITADLAYAGNIFEAIAGVMGDDTESQLNVEDYSHVMLFQGSNYGKFSSVAVSYGSASGELLVFPSVKFYDVDLSGAVNGVGQVVVQGAANRILPSGATATVSTLSGLTYPTGYQHAVFGGANHHCRIDDADTSTLNSSDDTALINFRLKLTRTLDIADRALQGANTPYIYEPKDSGIHRIMLDLTFRDVPSTFNLLSSWAAGTQKLGEIYLDGDQVAGDAGNANKSIKIQIPKFEIKPGSLPQGFDVPDTNGARRPSVSCECFKVDTAPTVMSGITDVAITTVDARTSAYC